MKAKWEAAWAGDFVYMCSEHMRKLVTIGTAMGIPVAYKEHLGDKICKNCENEKEKLNEIN